MADARAADSHDLIEVRGARENNLADIEGGTSSLSLYGPDERPMVPVRR